MWLLLYFASIAISLFVMLLSCKILNGKVTLGLLLAFIFGSLIPVVNLIIGFASIFILAMEGINNTPFDKKIF